jgi:hypothetical protein
MSMDNKNLKIVVIGFLTVAALFWLSTLSSPKSQPWQVQPMMAPQVVILSTPEPGSESDTYVQVLAAQFTAESAQATAAFGSSLLTATAEEGLRNDRATATERAWLAVQSTQAAADRATTTAGVATAQAQAVTLTAGADRATSTAQARETQDAYALQLTSTVDQAFVVSQARIQEANAEMAELAAEREREMNRLAAIFPYAFIGLLMILVSIVIAIFVVASVRRLRVVRDAQGNITHVLNPEGRWIPSWYIEEPYTPGSGESALATQGSYHRDLTMMAFMQYVFSRLAVMDAVKGPAHQAQDVLDIVRQMGLMAEPQAIPSNLQVVDVDASDPYVQRVIQDTLPKLMNDED